MITVINGPTKPKLVKCHNCNSELSYTYEDVEKITHIDWNGDQYHHCSLNCPVCQTKIIVDRWV